MSVWGRFQCPILPPDAVWTKFYKPTNAMVAGEELPTFSATPDVEVWADVQASPAALQQLANLGEVFDKAYSIFVDGDPGVKEKWRCYIDGAWCQVTSALPSGGGVHTHIVAAQMPQTHKSVPPPA